MILLMMVLAGIAVAAVAKVCWRRPNDVLPTVALAITGAVAVGIVVRELGWYARGEAAGLVASALGAAVLVTAYRLYLHARSEPPP